MTPNDLIISHDVEDFYRIDNPIKTNIWLYKRVAKVLNINLENLKELMK
jgi:hypothetical protein